MKLFVLGLVALVVLGGCVSVPMKLTDLQGRVDFPQPLTRAGYLNLELYTQVDGQSRLIGQQRYQVSMLPLYYDFSVDSTMLASGTALIKAELSWQDGGAAQAQSSKLVRPGHPGKLMLKPRACYPHCRLGIAQ
ncbi:YscW family type III secretion system pilotin [Pseudomonas entomophila]|uniref:YscW family type III secretion system pilotin n=1 Tax=Pseudomonas entomophila TaxID=312306 RepID=UPI001F01B458|nr:YscW family type III secretion system pilotin [Pseudomonas entomophila]MCG8291446.1 YscW family type III secretion system pilotin [Pseudomonas entomophila]